MFLPIWALGLAVLTLITGIFDTINLTCHNVEPNFPLIFSCFWSAPWTLLCSLLISWPSLCKIYPPSILVVDDEISFLFDQPFKDLGCYFNRSPNGYPYFITALMKKMDIISNAEHIFSSYFGSISTLSTILQNPLFMNMPPMSLCTNRTSLKQLGFGSWLLFINPPFYF